MNLNIPKPLATTSKIQIKQHVPIGSIRKGPHAIERSLVPDEVVIKRRFGEGSKPLFQRDDIVVNPDSVLITVDAQKDKQVPVGNKINTGDTSNRWRKERHDSTDSSSPERYRKYHNKSNNESEVGPSDRNTRRTKTTKPSSDDKHAARRDVTPPTNRRRKTPEKIPYFIDQVRERDRIRRKYGSTKTQSPPTSTNYRRRRSGSRTRSRSHSPVSMRTNQRSQTRRTHFRRSISMDRYKSDSTKREREKSRTDTGFERTPSHYRQRSEDRSKQTRRRRSSRTHSRSRTRSRERTSRTGTHSSERHKQRHSERDGASNEDVNQGNLPQPQPQIITIPVPVPADFMNYAYPTWPTPQWAPQPTRYGPPTYHMPNFLPAVLPPMRQPMPPYGLPPQPLRYGGPGYRPPPQYGASRAWRPNSRPKNT